MRPSVDARHRPGCAPTHLHHDNHHHHHAHSRRRRREHLLSFVGETTAIQSMTSPRARDDDADADADADDAGRCHYSRFFPLFFRKIKIYL